MRKGNKKKWGRPKLIILVRGKPEEMVLSNCKDMNGIGGAFNVEDGCLETAGCSLCTDFVVS